MMTAVAIMATLAFLVQTWRVVSMQNDRDWWMRKYYELSVITEELREANEESEANEETEK